MVTLMMRPYAGEADLAPIVELVNACEAVDQVEDGTSIQELRDELAYPNVDTGQDIRLWESADGSLAAFAMIWKPQDPHSADGFVWMKVHPQARGSGVEGDIFAWAAQRMRQVGSERDAAPSMRTGARTDRPERIAMLEQHGFVANRYFLRMRRDLHAPIADPVLPEGFTLRMLAGAHEVPAWVDLFNLSFIDHYNHHDLTVEERQHWLSEGTYRAEQDLIAVAPDGTFAAFCKCYISDEENQRNGRNDGWISLLGTRRGFRGIGLGRAMILAGMQQLRRDGADWAMLGVDADSPTGATRLYESVGFETVFTSIAFVREL